jgi:crotonobetainyl-CoA:carnitine CoA-transferase CaiB-like acyl-CoA transferase
LAGLGFALADDSLEARLAGWWMERLGADAATADVVFGAGGHPGDDAVVVEIGGPEGADDTDLWVRSGMAWVTRMVEPDGTHGARVAPGDRQAAALSGAVAALAGLAGLWEREVGGRAPRRISIDRLELLTAMLMNPLASNQILGDAAVPLIDRTAGGVMETLDGPVYARPVEPRQWLGLLERVPGLEDVKQRLADGDATVLPERRDAINAGLADWLAGQHRDQVVEEVQRSHVPLTAILRPDEVADNKQMAARGFSPGDSLPWLTLTGPQAGEGSAARPHDDTGGGGPLAGLRVLDLTWAWAGPFATMLLADLGADVINVETKPRLSNLRCQPPFPAGGGPPDASGWWSANQRGKRSVGIDLKNPEGVKLIHALAERSDVVIENFSPGVVDRLGVGFTDLLAANPRLAYVSMSAFGKEGPQSHFVGYGPHIQAASGGSYIGGSVSQMDIPYPDPVSGFIGALAALAYALGARRDDRPAALDVSELECMAGILAAAEPVPTRDVEARGPAEVLEDPWLVERGYFVEDRASGLQGTGTRIGGSLFAVDGRRLELQGPAPDLFAHTREVLQDTLGFDERRIEQLRRAGAVEFP